MNINEFVRSSVFTHFITKAVRFLEPGIKQVILKDETPCCTSNSTIILNPFEKIDSEKVSKEKQLEWVFAQTMAQAGHELGHYWWSDFNGLEDKSELEKFLANIIEDAAVNEALTYCAWPGLGRLIHLRNKKHISELESIELEFTAQNTLAYLIQLIILNCKKITFEFPDSDTEKKLHSIADILEVGSWQKNGEDRLLYAVDAAKIFTELFPESAHMSYPSEAEHKPRPDAMPEDMPFPSGAFETYLPDKSSEGEASLRTEMKAKASEPSDAASTDKEPRTTEAGDEAFSAFVKMMEDEFARREKEELPSLSAWSGHENVDVVIRKNPDWLSVKDEYNLAIYDYQSYIRNQAKILVQSVRTERDEWLGNRTGKLLNIPHIITGKRENPFRRKNAYGETPDFAFSFLCDQSSSMSGEMMSFCQRAVSVVAEMAYSAKVPLSILGHGAITGKNKVGIWLYKPFSANLREDFQMAAGVHVDQWWPQNRDGLAVRWTGEYCLKNSPAKQTILLVLSDGEPCHGGTSYRASYERDCPVIGDLRKQVDLLERRGLTVYGIGYGKAGLEAVRRCYKRVIPAEKPKELLPRIIELAKQYFPAAEG